MAEVQYITIQTVWYLCFKYEYNIKQYEPFQSHFSRLDIRYMIGLVLNTFMIQYNIGTYMLR
mgnify:CR=1 FL=1